jgi:hypothetical protein
LNPSHPLNLSNQSSTERTARAPKARPSVPAQSRPVGLEQVSNVAIIEFQTEDPNIKIIWFPNPHTSTTGISGAANEQPN